MDAVITYVNITEKFRDDYYLHTYKHLKENRFRSYGVLDLQIKGIRKYMQYIKNIFVVVCDKEQVDGYDLGDAIIIEHKDIIPSRFLPCFNSCTIEMFLHKIPNLSEEFIYFNDDIFITAKVPKTYWFINHKPVLFPKEHTVKAKELNVYRKNCVNSTTAAASITGKDYEGKYITQAHCARPFLRSSYMHVFNLKIMEIIHTLTRIRHSKNFNATLFNDYDYFSGNCYILENKYTYINIKESVEDVMKKMTDSKNPIICINDNDEAIGINIFKEQLRIWLECNLEGKPYPVKKEEEIPIIEEPTVIEETVIEEHKEVEEPKVIEELIKEVFTVKEQPKEKPIKKEINNISEVKVPDIKNQKVESSKVEIQKAESQIKKSFNVEKDVNNIKIALCAIAKNENLYIEEWVNWYKNLGITKIFLYDNNDISGEHFEDVINEYINSGFVKVINRRGVVKTTGTDKLGETTQGLAYYDCYSKYYTEYDWICFFDIDEFLEIYDKYENIFDFLNDFKDYDGIRVQWKMYGDNNELYYYKQPVNKRFKKDSNAGYDRHVKQILNTKRIGNKKLSFCAHGILEKEYTCVNVLKIPVKNVYMDIKAYDNLPVYLNHFYSKSTEEFFKRKFNKTSAVTGINMKRNFDIDFLKKQYFEYNKVTEDKENYINIFTGYNNTVNVYMASLYKDGHVIKSIKSIINQPQVKSLTLSANNYTDEEYNYLISEIKSDKLFVHRTKNEKKSYEKLRFVLDDKNTDYVAFCDDDLIFYDGYFARMIFECEKNNSVVSYHGCILKKPLPIEHYYTDRKSYSFNKIVSRNIVCDIIGNGVSLFRREYLTDEQWKYLYDNAPDVSMDDITVSYMLRKNGKKLIIVKHDSCNIIEKPINEDTVYNLYKKNDFKQTEYVNKYFTEL